MPKAFWFHSGFNLVLYLRGSICFNPILYTLPTLIIFIPGAFLLVQYHIFLKIKHFFLDNRSAARYAPNKHSAVERPFGHFYAKNTH